MKNYSNLEAIAEGEVQRDQTKSNTFNSLIRKMLNNQVCPASKHLFQDRRISKHAHKRDFSLMEHSKTNSNLSMFSIDLAIDQESTNVQEVPEHFSVLRKKHKKSPTAFSELSGFLSETMLKSEPISKHFRPIKIINRSQAKELFVLESIQSGKKMLMRVTFKVEFKDGYTLRNESQIQNLMTISHSAFPAIQQIYQECNKCFLIFEHQEGVTLHQFMLTHPINQEIVKNILKQLLEALDYLHSLEIVHRDIRPENIYVTDFEQDVSRLKIKIVDLSLSTTLQKLKKNKKNASGSSFYAPPEALNGFINLKYDIWSVGILAIILFSNYDQFNSNQQLFFESITNKTQLHLQNLKNITKNAATFINFLLISKHTFRPSASHALKHAWLSNNQAQTLTSFRSHRKLDQTPFIKIY